jgi:hypothetical protein
MAQAHGILSGDKEMIQAGAWSVPKERPRSSRFESQSVIAQIFSVASVLYALSYIVNGAIPQLEMLLTGGRIPIALSSLEFFVCLLAAAALSSFRLQHSPLLYASAALACYTIVDGCILWATTQYSIVDLRGAIAAFSVPLVVIGVALSVPISVKYKHVLTMVLLLFLGCFYVSLMQFITNLPIVQIQSADNSFFVQAYGFSDRIRAFSLFASGLNAGLFYCFLAGFGANLCFSRRHRIYGFLILGMSAFGCYATITRLTIIGMVACVVTVLVIRSRRLRPVVPWIPLVWALLGIGVIAQAVYASGQAEGSGVQNRSSIDSRIAEWKYYTDKYATSTVGEMTFGTGLSPYRGENDLNPPPTAAIEPVDNAILELLLNSGFVGLMFVVFFCWKFWVTLYRKALAGGNSLLVAATALVAVVPFFFLINDLMPEIYMMGLLALMSSQEDATPAPSSPPRVPTRQTLDPFALPN